MRFPLLAAALAAFLPWSDAAVAKNYRDRSAPIGVVANLDIERYLGKWYEIARFPNRFERDCEGVTAEYAMRDDGKIRVLNTCRKGSPDGPVETAEGVATVDGPGRLKVTFVPWLPFAKGDYWVLHVDAAYSFAVVGEPKGNTGWILARAPQMAQGDYDKAIAVLQAAGYDTSRLRRVQQ